MSSLYQKSSVDPKSMARIALNNAARNGTIKLKKPSLSPPLQPTPPIQKPSPQSVKTLYETPVRSSPRSSVPLPSPRVSPRVQVPLPSPRSSVPLPSPRVSPRVPLPSPRVSPRVQVPLPSPRVSPRVQVPLPSPRSSVPLPSPRVSPRVQVPLPSPRVSPRVQVPLPSPRVSPRVQVPLPSPRHSMSDEIFPPTLKVPMSDEIFPPTLKVPMSDEIFPPTLRALPLNSSFLSSTSDDDETREEISSLPLTPFSPRLPPPSRSMDSIRKQLDMGLSMTSVTEDSFDLSPPRSDDLSYSLPKTAVPSRRSSIVSHGSYQKASIEGSITNLLISRGYNVVEEIMSEGKIIFIKAVDSNGHYVYISVDKPNGVMFQMGKRIEVKPTDGSICKQHQLAIIEHTSKHACHAMIEQGNEYCSVIKSKDGEVLSSSHRHSNVVPGGNIRMSYPVISLDDIEEDHVQCLTNVRAAAQRISSQVIKESMDKNAKILESIKQIAISMAKYNTKYAAVQNQISKEISMFEYHLDKYRMEQSKGVVLSAEKQSKVSLIVDHIRDLNDLQYEFLTHDNSMMQAEDYFEEKLKNISDSYIKLFNITRDAPFATDTLNRDFKLAKSWGLSPSYDV
jgi:hypothetical protein